MTTTTTTPDPQAEALALAFAALLRRDLTESQWAEMQARNATPAYGGPVCASHDFTDSNMQMAEAFEMVTGREPLASYETHYDATQGRHVADDPAEEAQCEADCRLWGDAWTIAADRYLITPGATRHATSTTVEALRARVAEIRAEAQAKA